MFKRRPRLAKRKSEFLDCYNSVAVPFNRFHKKAAKARARLRIHV